jgi:hypothetical protein
MIKEITMYTILCDNCKLDVTNNYDYTALTDKGQINYIALESGWIIVNDDKHYCPNCFSHNEDGEIIIHSTPQF